MTELGRVEWPWLCLSPRFPGEFGLGRFRWASSSLWLGLWFGGGGGDSSVECALDERSVVWPMLLWEGGGGWEVVGDKLGRNEREIGRGGVWLESLGVEDGIQCGGGWSRFSPVLPLPRLSPSRLCRSVISQTHSFCPPCTSGGFSFTDELGGVVSVWSGGASSSVSNQVEWWLDESNGVSNGFSLLCIQFWAYMSVFCISRMILADPPSIKLSTQSNLFQMGLVIRAQRNKSRTNGGCGIWSGNWPIQESSISWTAAARSFLVQGAGGTLMTAVGGWPGGRSWSHASGYSVRPKKIRSLIQS